MGYYWFINGSGVADPHCYDAVCNYLAGEIKKVECEEGELRTLIRPTFLTAQDPDLVVKDLERWLNKQGWEVTIRKRDIPQQEIEAYEQVWLSQVKSSFEERNTPK